ncbi:MAG: DNA-directed RNA polymerase subunit omega [Lentisphaerae bacterium]|nr:DNA-directed RNA polymerase subunit omega [Lentisphaerota bacterium]MCP4103778.1 DNA-directed RNA polymerase subunit omega [Lentisphaerota bacterium]
MNNNYLERAKAVISEPQILSIIAGKRAKQLALGARPMVKCDSENYLDVALLEIAEGKIYYTEGIADSENEGLDALKALGGEEKN